MKSILTVLALWAAALTGFAQDLIIFKDGSRISCRVMSVDTAQIVYRTGGSKVSSAPRDAVQRYFLSRRTEARLSRPGPSTGTLVPKGELVVVSGGVTVSQPTGEFASVIPENAKAGFAANGVALDIGAVFKLTDVVGLKAIFRSQSNKFAKEEFCSALEAAYPGVSFSCQSERWTLNGLFGGLSLRLPLGNASPWRLTIDGEAGVPRCAFPQIVSTGYAGGGSATIEQSAFPSSAFAWSAGAGLSYELAENIAARFYAEFVKAIPKFAVGVYLNGSLVDQYSYEQLMTTFNVGLGLSVIIPKK